MNIQTAFYELNRHQSFPFPHANCDELSNSELITWLYRPDYFTMRVLRHFRPDASYAELGKLRDNPTVTLLGITWMRLKYIAEICDPSGVRIQRERATEKLRTREAALFNPWAAESATKRYANIDALANKIQMAFLTYIGIPDTPPLPDIVLDTLEEFNAAIHSIRKTPYRGCDWSGQTAYNLVPYIYFVYITELWRCVHSIMDLLY